MKVKTWYSREENSLLQYRDVGSFLVARMIVFSYKKKIIFYNTKLMQGGGAVFSFVFFYFLMSLNL